MEDTDTLIRTHVIMPKKILAALDKTIGKRKRSQFIAQAAQEKLERLTLLKAARDAAGILENAPIPDWETSKSSRAWVKKLRHESDKRVSQP